MPVHLESINREIERSGWPAMNKLQKSKTLSLGRLATLSTIKENLRVKTAFQKNELPPPSPNVLLNLLPNNLNGGDMDSPPLLFSAISSYKPEKSPPPAAENGYDHEGSNHSSPLGKHPHNGLKANGSPAKGSVSNQGQFASPKLTLRIPEGHQQQQCEEDFEPELFQPKLHRLYQSGNGSETLIVPIVEREPVGAHSLEDSESLLDSSAGSPRSSSYGDDLEKGTTEDSEDEEYWSIPPRVSGLAIDRRDLATGDKWIPRHPDLVRVKGYHPFIAEAPLTTLMHFGFLTPTSLHYVHNHGPVPHASWDNWTVEVTGLVRTPKKFTMRDLLLFPPRRLPVTLMSSGNRGKELSRVGNSGKELEGLNWGPGAVSTSVWGGARLRDVIKYCGFTLTKGQKKKGNQWYVRLLGADRYGTSIPLDVALDESRDVLLAYEQNMDLLTSDQGFPVRLIVPGFAEGRSVKWLHRIEISDQDSDNPYHALENRMLPSHIEDLQTALSEGWTKREEFMINDMNVTSVISSPAHNSNILCASPSNPMKEYSIKGYAYSGEQSSPEHVCDGSGGRPLARTISEFACRTDFAVCLLPGAGKKISRVEVSLDGGKSWKLSNIDYPERPTKYGKYWCWCFWELNVEVENLSTSAEIVVRAWDSAMNTQPEVFVWNVLGVMNNCWYRVKITQDPVIDEDEPSTLRFEHPVQPGSIPGGWLQEPARLGHEIERTDTVKFRHSESSSSLDVGEFSPRTPRPWFI